MKSYRTTLVMAIANLALLILVLTGLLPGAGGACPGVAEARIPTTQTLRGRALEIVDEGDRIRARIDVEEGGEVVLRLVDPDGTIRVKLGAGENGSGLLLLDEETEPGVHLIARRRGTEATPTTTSVTLRAGEDRERVIAP